MIRMGRGVCRSCRRPSALIACFAILTATLDGRCFGEAFSAAAPRPSAATATGGSTRAKPLLTVPVPRNREQEDEIQYLVEVGRRELQGLYTFPLDDWQLQAGGAIWEGHNVIVSAPTGAGKTVVGEMALRIAFQQPGKAGIYTTPLKALSNQKYSELAAIFGRANTGLSTGDISINKGARVTVMTTEVYRNIAWRSSTPTASALGGYNDLAENAVVVLDEFHYMGHPGRGGVWEESIIVSPSHTQVVGLSATLSNAPALAAWMESVTGRRTILVEVPASKRPVPLRYLFATKEGLYPLFRESDAGPGAPLGLLGYRGDGEPPKQSVAMKGKSSGGFGKDDEDGDQAKNTKLPRGLQVNPALRAAAAKRLERVDRALERQKVRRRIGSDFDGEWGERASPRNQVYQSRKKLSAKEEQKERERLLKKEMRRAVPSMHALMTRLAQKELLPAIFFIFSRAGCDEAARLVYRYMKEPRDPSQAVPVGELDEFAGKRRRDDPKIKTGRQRTSRRKGVVRDSDGRVFRPGNNYVSEDMILSSLYEVPDQVLRETDFDDSDSSPLAVENWDYYSIAGLLSYNEVRQVASRIAMFNKDNIEIAFDDDLIEQYMFGIGSHHAGMLPAHKSFVEVLFRNQLIKIVFATETLAAGINMPARSTVICSMAKRGGNGSSSMSLLETSNLLQMAGRAGRRGMDTDGTCVIVATPFESHDDAAKILTDPIAPIASQFSPSFSLCVNLIARGDGGLTVAKQLVSKSFAMWERRQAEENNLDLTGPQGDAVSDALLASAHNKFINALVDTLQLKIDQKTAKFDVARLELLLEVLNDQKSLKRTSKSFVGASKMLELETVTLNYLEKELAAARVGTERGNEEDCDGHSNEYEPDLRTQIEIQRNRATNTKFEVSKHPFSALAAIASALLKESTPEAIRLAAALGTARRELLQDSGTSILSPEELSVYAKSAVVFRRKTRKLAKANPGVDPETILDDGAISDDAGENSWDDFLSITRTLVEYGCLTTKSPLRSDSNLEEETFEIAPAGLNIGMLAFENSLWALVAMGGAWDATGASSNLDVFRDAMSAFDKYDGEQPDERPTLDDLQLLPKPQAEADALVSLLKRLSPSELAGYVSSLISEDSRGGGPSVVDLFQRLTPYQQQVVQQSLLCLERLVEVQKKNLVDEATRSCNL